jgi:hypothetical protein
MVLLISLAKGVSAAFIKELMRLRAISDRKFRRSVLTQTAMDAALDRDVVRGRNAFHRERRRRSGHNPRMRPQALARCLLSGQAPLRSRVCDPEAFSLGIALRAAASLRNHHRQVAALVEGVSLTLAEERSREPAAAPLRNRSRAAEQCNTVVETQHARFAIEIGGECTPRARKKPRSVAE